MRRRTAILIGAAAAILCIGGHAGDNWRWRLPAGIDRPIIPADNRMSAAKVALGRRLFYDADLSIDGTMSCGTCHEQHRGFADGNATHPGVRGAPGRRNVPGLANIAWAASLTSADPRITTLEAQVLVPVLGDHPIEMGMKGEEAEIVRRLGSDDCYRHMFNSAFPESGGRIEMTAIARAIAAFERTLIAYDTPFDRYRQGHGNAIPPAARHGAGLFAAYCATCHAGPNFSDGGYHALEARPDATDRGLAEVTGKAADNGRFRTPGLRNVALTAPYLHDGSAKTLGDAIGRHGATLARPTRLSDAESADLIALLRQLTDRRFVTDTDFAMPKKACGRRL